MRSQIFPGARSNYGRQSRPYNFGSNMIKPTRKMQNDTKLIENQRPKTWWFPTIPTRKDGEQSRLIDRARDHGVCGALEAQLRNGAWAVKPALVTNEHAA